MNNYKEVLPNTIKRNPFEALGKDWMLITAGNQEKANTMTASWGGFGVMYGKNVAYIVVRPQRYTKEFIDREDSFSLSFLDKSYRDALNYLGTVSGRNEDKITISGLTLDFLEETPYFTEANLVFFCKKLFMQQLDPSSFLCKKLDSTFYPGKDYHFLYIAEITKAIQTSR